MQLYANTSLVGLADYDQMIEIIYYNQIIINLIKTVWIMIDTKLVKICKFLDMDELFDLGINKFWFSFKRNTFSSFKTLFIRKLKKSISSCKAPKLCFLIQILNLFLKNM